MTLTSDDENSTFGIAVARFCILDNPFFTSKELSADATIVMFLPAPVTTLVQSKLQHRHLRFCTTRKHVTITSRPRNWTVPS
jgi:hypothetical protein